MNLRLGNQLARFAVVGLAGLLVDLSLLFLAAPWLGWYVGRVLSFWAAASLTWWLNRRFTFATLATADQADDDSRGKQYLRYLGSMMVGAALNYGAYALTLHIVQGPAAAALGVAIGSMVGMLANFFTAKRLVFNR